MEVWAFLGSLIGFVAFGQTFLNGLLPWELLKRLACAVETCFSSYCFVDIPEYDGVTSNELYAAIKLHLSSTATVSSAKRLCLCRATNSATFTYTPSNSELVQASFEGARLWWEHQVSQRQAQGYYAWKAMPDEKRAYVLKLHKREKERVLVPYLEHILQSATEIRRRSRERLLYTNSKSLAWESRSQPWEAVPFNHPSTFDTLALHPDRKATIMADLEAFVGGEKFYQRTGRAWKRGYLLYGPPGTGKSSMIAAMANHLGYDVYDLELTEVSTNAELRRLLIRTTNKSIIVIEDIDCSSLSLYSRAKPEPTGGGMGMERRGRPEGQDAAGAAAVTLSGLLNFTDGLWSCCGSERIFVFTTNHVERLDPALLRSGRMDVHVLMPYCDFPAFCILAANYLRLHDHALFPAIHTAIAAGARITPADVSELLIKHRDHPDAALQAVAAELHMGSRHAKPPPLLLHSAGEDCPAEDFEEKHALGEDFLLPSPEQEPTL